MRALRRAAILPQLHGTRAAAVARRCNGSYGWPWAHPDGSGDDEGPRNEGGHVVLVGKGYEQLRNNWAENVSLRGGGPAAAPAPLVSPADTEELRAVIANSDEVAVVGSAHSFNDCVALRPAVATPQGSRALISTAFLSSIDGINEDAMTVRCGGGTTISQLCRYLHPRGAALRQSPSLPHVTVAGAMATATHGSGHAEQALSAHAARIELVTASGDVHVFERGTDDHRAAAVSLGLLGVVSAVDFDIVPAYDIHQRTYANVPMSDVSASEVLGMADGVSMLVDLAEPVPHALVSLRDRVDPGTPMANPPETFFGGALVTEPMSCFESHAPTWLTGAGPWYDKLHYFLDRDRDATMGVRSLQFESFVRLSDLDAAVEAVRPVAARWPGWRTWDEVRPETQGPTHIVELRSVRADDLWLSPCSSTNPEEVFASFHFTMGYFPGEVHQCLSEFEDALASFSPRPHWGKLWLRPPTEQDNPHLGEFVTRMRRLDPGRKFSQGSFAARALGLRD